MGTLNTVQQEQLKAIGTYLSEVRQEQDRSLEDIAARTYIPLRLLKAMEAGQEKPLPEPVFVQGFIRRYADILGLDGMELSQKFPVHVTPLPTTPAVAANRAFKVKAAAGESYEPLPYDEHDPTSSRAPSRLAPWMPYLVAAAVLAFGGIALGIVKAISSRQPDRSPNAVVLPKQPVPVPSVAESPKPESPEPVLSPVVVSPAAAPRTSPAPRSPEATPSEPVERSSVTAARSPAAGNLPVNVVVNLTGESWVQVVVDGEVKAEGVLPKGTQQNWSGRREITIVAGNAGAVSVAQNGAAAKVMGAAGDVTEARFVPKN